MGCSSCQQNNHVVPTTQTVNTTTNCNCACGCSEPVCPTPQPCTEITDSKCIIYTGDNIVCGNEIIIPKGASMEIALKAIVDFICSIQPGV